jgi:hypothetical protein
MIVAANNTKYSAEAVGIRQRTMAYYRKKIAGLQSGTVGYRG